MQCCFPCIWSIKCGDFRHSRQPLSAENSYGATSTYQMMAKSPEDNAKELVSQSDQPEGFDIVIDATGAEPWISCGVHGLKRGGVFVKAGLGKSKVEVAPICGKEATFKGSFRYGPGDYLLAIELLSSGRVHLEELITHEYQFAEAEKAFDNVAERRGIKTIIYGPGVDKEIAQNL